MKEESKGDSFICWQETSVFFLMVLSQICLRCSCYGGQFPTERDIREIPGRMLEGCKVSPASHSIRQKLIPDHIQGLVEHQTPSFKRGLLQNVGTFQTTTIIQKASGQLYVITTILPRGCRLQCEKHLIYRWN